MGHFQNIFLHQSVEKHTSAEAVRKWDAHSRDRQETLRGRRVCAVHVGETQWRARRTPWSSAASIYTTFISSYRLSARSSASFVFGRWFRHNTHKGCWRPPCELSQVSETIPIFIPLPNLHTKADINEPQADKNLCHYICCPLGCALIESFTSYIATYSDTYSVVTT